MSELEREFLLAVQRGELDTLRQFLKTRSLTQLNVNCRDPLVRNALIISIDNRNLETIRLLLETDIRRADALLYAIKENFVEAVELLLDGNSAASGSSQATTSPQVYREKTLSLDSSEAEEEYCFFSSDMSPLMLAAQKNNLEIVKLLLDRKVSPICDPHDPRCGCNTCCLARSRDCLKHSRARINAYRALSSPSLMALSSSDPLETAFKMSAKLEHLAKLEPEYKEDYMRLRSKCQAYATKLLDYARTSRELETLLDFNGSCSQSSSEGDDDGDDEGDENGAEEQEDEFDLNYSRRFRATNRGRKHFNLARLKLAIECKQKTFCAHPNIQDLLASMWYENLPGFRRMSITQQALQVLAIGLMFPIYSAAYLLVPNSRFGQYIRKPFIKFICHSASYITFITLLSQVPASSKRRGALPSPIESLTLIWVLSLIWAELKQIHSLGINYYRHDMWNLLDSVASGCYIGTIILRIISYVQSDEHSLQVAREHWNAYDPTLLSEGLFAIGTVFSSLKLVYIFSVNPYLGPLQISLGRMIIDILRFSWIYMLVLFAFACGMNQLLWYYADLERYQCLNVTSYNLAQYYKAKQELHLEVAQTVSGLSSNSTAPVNGTEMATGANVTLINTLAPKTSATSTPATNLTRSTNESNAAGHSNLQLGSEILSNLTVENLLESALSASLEDDSNQLPITIDDSCKTWRHFSNVFESSQTLFWANFGLVDLENFELTGIRQYTRFWALLMFGCYCFINVIVVLNLLVAMMNHSYDKISTRSDIEWKFARTRLWMSYFDNGSTVPAPFNIIPSIKSMRYLCRRIGRRTRRLNRWLKSCLASGRTAQATRGGDSTLVGSRNNLPIKVPLKSSQDQAPQDYPNPVDALHLFGDPPGRMDAAANRPPGDQRRNRLNYRIVIRTLVRRYLVDEQRKLEKGSALTEVKLKRWSKLNIF